MAACRYTMAHYHSFVTRQTLALPCPHTSYLVLSVCVFVWLWPCADFHTAPDAAGPGVVTMTSVGPAEVRLVSSVTGMAGTADVKRPSGSDFRVAHS